MFILISFYRIIYEIREMVDKKKTDQSKHQTCSRHYINELCGLSADKSDEIVARSLKLYVSLHAN